MLNMCQRVEKRVQVYMDSGHLHDRRSATDFDYTLGEPIVLDDDEAGVPEHDTRFSKSTLAHFKRRRFPNYRRKTGSIVRIAIMGS